MMSTSTMTCLTSPLITLKVNSAFKEGTQSYCTAQDRLSAKFQALSAGGMYKNEPLAMSLEIRL